MATTIDRISAVCESLRTENASGTPEERAERVRWAQSLTRIARRGRNLQPQEYATELRRCARALEDDQIAPPEYRDHERAIRTDYARRIRQIADSAIDDAIDDHTTNNANTIRQQEDNAPQPISEFHAIRAAAENLKAQTDAETPPTLNGAGNYHRSTLSLADALRAIRDQISRLEDAAAILSELIE